MIPASTTRQSAGTAAAAPGLLRSAALALRSWTPRQRLAALGFAVGFALLIGLPTVLIPNPVFGREIAATWWSYPVWLLTSALAGMLAATYLRMPTPPASPGATSDAALGPALDGDPRPSRWGVAGGLLAWFAVGCPVCNKVALLALGYSGAITWFAPVQPVLAVAALVATAGALVVRLRGQVSCAVPARRRAPRGDRSGTPRRTRSDAGPGRRPPG